MATDWQVSEVGDTCRPAAGPRSRRSVQIEWISAGTAHLGFAALLSVPHLLSREIIMNRRHWSVEFLARFSLVLRFLLGNELLCFRIIRWIARCRHCRFNIPAFSSHLVKKKKKIVSEMDNSLLGQFCYVFICVVHWLNALCSFLFLAANRQSIRILHWAGHWKLCLRSRRVREVRNKVIVNYTTFVSSHQRA